MVSEVPPRATPTGPLLLLGLILGLFLQLPLREITEPYPAILLPGGGVVLRAGSEITGTEREYLVEDTVGATHPFLIDLLFDSVPRNYRLELVDRGFGINQDRDVRRRDVTLFGTDFTLQFGRPLSAAQVEETRGWLRDRLKNALAIDPVRIHVLSYEVNASDVGPKAIERRRTLRDRTTVELLE